METKKCTKCNVEKSLNKFSARKKAKDGLQQACKSCNLEYRIINRAKINEQNREYIRKKRLHALGIAIEPSKEQMVRELNNLVSHIQKILNSPHFKS